MQYGVISNYSSNNKMCNFCVISDDGGFNVTAFKTCSEEEVVLASRNLGLKLLNFSIDRDGSIKQDCGSFSRFHKDGVFVVIAVIKKRSGKVVGYRLLNSLNNTIVNQKVEDIVYLEKMQGRPVLQNAMVRGGTVCCYPCHRFPEMVIAKPARKNSKKSTPKEQEKEVKAPKQVARPQPASNTSKFSDSQKKEIITCRKHGINSDFIENPELSAQQMRVLWVSKSKGCYSEEFASPKYNFEVMKFYADRLFSEKAVENCRPMLSNPSLTVEQLQALYECLLEGVDITNLASENKTADELYYIRADKALEWNAPQDIPEQVFQDDVLTKAVSYARKVRGF